MTWHFVLFALAVAVVGAAVFGLLVYVALAGDIPDSWDDGGYEDWDKRGGWR